MNSCEISIDHTHCRSIAEIKGVIAAQVASHRAVEFWSACYNQ